MHFLEHNTQFYQRKGFTLIEILLVIALIAILASIVIVAINPTRQLEKARDAQRLSDVYEIINALYQYAVDNEGAFPSNITTNNYEICRTGASSCTNLYDLSVLTDNSAYLVSLPLDPLCGTPNGDCDETNGTGYYLEKTSTGRIRVTADGEQIVIDVTR